MVWVFTSVVVTPPQTLVRVYVRVVAVVQPATVASVLVRVSVPLPAALPVAVVRAATLA